MALCQDPCKGGQGFLGAVLMVAGDEDEVLALTGAAVTFVDERSIRVEGMAGGKKTDGQD
jgi:hypothetical protein